MRVLLLSPKAERTSSDADLRATVEDLLAALTALEPAWDVRCAEAASLADIERVVHAARPDVVFNSCETLYGSSAAEPLVPWLLDHLGVAFTGSGASCLARCLDKAATVETLRMSGVPVPATYEVAGTGDETAIHASSYPLIVKPRYEDGSVGIDATSVVHDAAALARRARELAARGQPAIAQEYVEGREIAVAMLGFPEPHVLPPGEIHFDDEELRGRPRILTYASKWDPSSADFRGTRAGGAVLSAALLDRLSRITLRAALALGVRDYGRVDFRVDPQGEAYVIDVNPNCDLSRDGGFMRAAARAGSSYARAISDILSCAAARAGLVPRRRAAG